MKSATKLLKKDHIFLTLVILITIITYSGIFKADFIHLDDYPLVVENQTIRNFGKSLSTLNIDIIFNSLIYSFFGLNSSAFHALNILLHISNVILAFYLFKKMFGIEQAQIAAFIFALHPVNTEAILWISGKNHLINTLFFLLVILTYLKERKDNKDKYPIKTIVLYTILSILKGSIWTLVIPPILLVISIFLLRESNKRVSTLWVFIIPIAIFLITSAGKITPENRLPENISTKKGAIGTYRNQEKLKPIIEGGPYTIYETLKLYTYPKTLSMYYDGTPINTILKVKMYGVTLLFLGSVIYLIHKKDYKSTGLLILLAVPLAPTFSPIKVTWYIAERYLYLGSMFYSILLVHISAKAFRKKSNKKLIYVLVGFLTMVYMYRINSRIKDWQNTLTLASATLRDTPKSIRASNDMGNGYMLMEKYETSLVWYNNSLQIDKYSNTAIKNIGLAILFGGPKALETQIEIQKVEYPIGETIESLDIFLATQDDLKTIFYLTQLLKKKPNDLVSLENLGDIFLKAQKYDFAKDIYHQVLSNNPTNEKILLNMGYIEFVNTNYKKALEYLEKAQETNPNNQNTKEYIQRVKTQMTFMN